MATHEIRFGDNDRLAALVAHLIQADALVLLSDVDALYDGPPRRAGSRRIPEVGGAADLAAVVVKGSASSVGTGGMGTKLEAAGIATAVVWRPCSPRRTALERASREQTSAPCSC